MLYDRAGEYALSHFIPRNLLTAYEREWPTGANRKRWLLSYPRGYRELIEKHAALNGQPAALEFAIVREESGFDPLMESFANAIGLTQLTAPPAARFAQGLPHDGKALRDPAINVTIGARELGQLWSAYGGAAALAIAGYNAGEGAVNKWMRDPERAGLTLDEFVEAIPYDETRGYTKRVLASFFAYSWLYDGNGAVPPLPLPMPPCPPPARSSVWPRPRRTSATQATGDGSASPGPARARVSRCTSSSRMTRSISSTITRGAGPSASCSRAATSKSASIPTAAGTRVGSASAASTFCAPVACIASR